jgi:hypothetical protein
MVTRAPLTWCVLVAVFFVVATAAHATDTVTSATVSSSTVVDKAPPTASSPSIVVNNSDICQTGTSGALQTALFGVSGGTTTRDLNCERIKLARAVYGMGLKVAGISLLCQEVRVFDALWMAGTPCPYMGSIGDEARENWIARPERSPEGSLLRAYSEKPVTVSVDRIPTPVEEFNYGLN